MRQIEIEEKVNDDDAEYFLTHPGEDSFERPYIPGEMPKEAEDEVGKLLQSKAKEAGRPGTVWIKVFRVDQATRARVPYIELDAPVC
jgi:hypothetical protein